MGSIDTLPGTENAVAVAAIDVVKDYVGGRGTRRAVDGVSIDVDRGRFVAVMGPSGSGKSTLLHLLGGLATPTGGEVRLEGQALAGLDDRALADVRRHKVGFVFQSYNLVPVLSVRDNVMLPAVLAGLSRRRVAARAEEVLALVGLADRAAELPGELSGGEQQRVAIARALVMNPALLLADEPTGNLDSATASQILLTIKRVQATIGQTVVLATHDARTAAFADEIVLLRDGRLSGKLELDGWTTPEALSVTRDRLGDDRMRAVLGWLQGDADAEPDRAPRSRRRKTRA